MSIPDQIHLLHVTPSFSTGGAQARTCKLINMFGDAYRHTVIALDGCFDAAGLISASRRVDYLAIEKTANPLNMMRRLVRVMKERCPHLVLTYNWGAIDAVVSARLAGVPLIHAEDGFGRDEASRQKLRRILYRRLVLGSAHAVVAPSLNLMRIMRESWRLPEEKLRYIPNGVDLEHFTPSRKGPARREIVLTTVGGLRPEKRQDLLIEICARASRSCPLRLVIAGDGPEKPKLLQKAEIVGFAGQVDFPGHLPDPRGLYHRTDVFVLSSCTEQMPLSVLEAMACGLPVVSTDVGDVRQMVSSANRRFIVAQPALFEAALTELAGDPSLRHEIGAANRERAKADFGLDSMVRQYEELYCSIIGRDRPVRVLAAC